MSKLNPFPWFARRARRLFIKLTWRLLVIIEYECISKMDEDAELLFLNYGYAEPDGEGIALDPDDERDRYSMQLYERVVRPVDLAGLEVLEVGCGRGGGVDYLARYHGPARVCGIDFCKGAIDFCMNHYDLPNVSFARQNAERLKVKPGTYDAVVNVESSHCYGRIEHFFAAVSRILRPGGHFLYTDFRIESEIGPLRDKLLASGLELLREDDISEGVVRALEVDAGRRREIIHRKAGNANPAAMENFAALPGTPMYERLRSGGTQYLCFHLRKPGPAQDEPQATGYTH